MSTDVCHCCHATFAECGYPDWICCPDCSHRPTLNVAAPTIEQIAAALHEECTAPVDYEIGLTCRSATNHHGQAERVRALLGGADNNEPS